jgi:chaperonin GroES
MAKDEKSNQKNAKMNIKPLGDRVLVRREEMPDKKSVSGIIIPDTAQKEKSKIGTVIAVGPGRVSDEGKLIPMDIEVGTKVIFNAGWDNEISIGDDEEYFLVNESDIRAMVK